jgi:putative ABC transport system permease protein
MFKILFRQLKYYWRSNLSIILVFTLMGLSFMYILQTSEKMEIQASEILDDQWRSGYDLLVHPNRPLEMDTQGLIRIQEVENNQGGISIEEYEIIKSIPGIEVAAPLSLIGNIEPDGLGIDFPINTPGFYLLESQTEVYDGIQFRNVHDPQPPFDTTVFQVMDRESLNNLGEEIFTILEKGNWLPISVNVNTTFRTTGYFWSLVGIDPEEERKLLNIDEVITDGDFLPTDNDGLLTLDGVPLIPIILLNQYYEAVSKTNVYKLDIDTSLSNHDIIDKGGIDFLTSQPKTKVVDLEFNPYSKDYLFQFGNASFINGEIVPQKKGFSYTDKRALFSLSPYQFELIGELDGSPLYEAQPVGSRGEQIDYRVSEEKPFNKKFGFDFYGVYDASLLESRYSTSSDPKSPDFYAPQSVSVTHNLAQEPYELHSKYMNSPYKTGYHTGGFDALTTLHAAEFMLGDKPISVIRVVVDGVGERTPDNMAKIELIAQKIKDETGLNVDIMLGAAEQKVQVLLDDYKSTPGYGYLLEGWVKPKASLGIESRVNSTNMLLGVYIFIVGILVLFLLYRNYFELRLKEIKIQSTLGWSTLKIINNIFIEELIKFLFTISILIILKLQFGELWGNEFWISGILLICLFIIAACFFYIYPVYRSIISSHSKSISVSKHMSRFPFKNIFSFAFYSLLRLKYLTTLKSLVITITVVYIYVFLITKSNTSNFLFLTFLGESINIALEGYQWSLFYVGILLSLTALFALDTNQMEKRLLELQLFQAWGWNKKKWVVYYFFQILLLNAFSLSLGLLIGFILLFGFSDFTHFNYLLSFILIFTTIMITTGIFFISLILRSRKNQLREFN